MKDILRGGGGESFIVWMRNLEGKYNGNAGRDYLIQQAGIWICAGDA